MRRTSVSWLKARPPTTKTAVGSNRLLDEPFLSKAKEIFARPEPTNKRVIHNWRFQVRAGKVATGPPVGQEFSKLGLKVMDFTKAFNDRTKPLFVDDVDLIVRIQVYFDKTYSYVIEPPPSSWFLLRVAKKKRRETGPVALKLSWAGYVTLEMLYEIAKFKQWNWDKPEYPPIETRVRTLIGQARRMGLCVLGVDAPDSPVRGMTQKEYEAQSAKYREEQAKQYDEFKMKELEGAPLYERLHRPNLEKLSYEQLKEGIVDPKLFADVWRASHPNESERARYNDKDVAMRAMNARGYFRELNHEELGRLMFNWRLPAAEQQRQLNEGFTETYWNRDEARAEAQRASPPPPAK